MKTTRVCLPLLIGMSGLASQAFASSLNVQATASTGIYGVATNLVHSDGSLSEVGVLAPVTANGDIFAGPQSILCSQTIGGEISSETNATLTFSQGWECNTTDQGYANFTPTSGAVFEFDLVSPTQLSITFTASTTGDDFGFLNTRLWVDGANYLNEQEIEIQNLGHWVSPKASGGWTLPILAAGHHALLFEDGSNISAGIFTSNGHLDETLTIMAVPEPSTWGILALGAGGLVSRRRRR